MTKPSAGRKLPGAGQSGLSESVNTKLHLRKCANRQTSATRLVLGRGSVLGMGTKSEIQETSKGRNGNKVASKTGTI